MMIHISRDGQQFGPYPIETARQMLAQGQLQPSDLAFQEGGQEWMPLGQLLGTQGDEMETYNRVAETVGGPSFRLKDNLIQGIVVVAGTGISAVVGLLMGGTQGLLMGLLGGLVVFGLGSGVVLMVMRMFKKGE